MDTSDHAEEQSTLVERKLTSRRISSWGSDPTHEGKLLITVKSAFLLRAADLNGLSDPYTVISIYSNKRYTKQKSRTQTIDLCLNPVWESKHEFDISGDNIMVYFEVFDYDRITADDVIGTCRFELPLEGGNFEVYNKLETKNHKPLMGALIVHITWIPKGTVVTEADEVEIFANLCGYEACGHIVVKALEAQDLKPDDMSKPCDTYLAVTTCPQKDAPPTSQSTTRRSNTVANSIAPVWDEVLRIPTDLKFDDDFSPLRLEVFREDLPNDISLGFAEVIMPPFGHTLKAVKNLGGNGLLLVEVWFEELGCHRAPALMIEEMDEGTTVNIFTLRQRMGDAYAEVRSAVAKSKKFEEEAKEAKKERDILFREVQKSEKARLRLEKQLEGAISRNECLRNELRHASETYLDDELGQKYVSSPKSGRDSSPGLRVLTNTIGEGASIPPTKSTGTALLFDGETTGSCANRAALWLCFNRITEDWGPKVRTELFSSLLEGAVHTSRCHEVNKLLGKFGNFLSFEDVLRVVDALNLHQKEWSKLVQQVRMLKVK